jgi:acetyl-CoA synthetase
MTIASAPRVERAGAHPNVSEAAVVGYPHDIKNRASRYVTLMAGEQPSEDLRKELVAWVRKDRPDRAA